MILGIFHSFPIFLELTLHWQKTLFSIFWCFRDPNDVQKTWKFTSIIFRKYEDLGVKEANERRPEAQNGVAHAARFLGRVGPTFWSLVAPLPSIFLPEASSWPKNDYKSSLPTPFRGEAAENIETPKQRSGAADWRRKTPVERCRRGLHLPQRHLHRLHDEEGVVHLWTTGLWQ